jgi:hypothetical protein
MPALNLLFKIRPLRHTGVFRKPDYGVQLLMSKDSADADHHCTLTNLYVVKQRNFCGIAFAVAALS